MFNLTYWKMGTAYVQYYLKVLTLDFTFPITNLQMQI